MILCTICSGAGVAHTITRRSDIITSVTRWRHCFGNGFWS